MVRSLGVVFVVSLALVCRETRSEEVILQDWETSTQPVLINTERPKMPGAMFAQDLEGWVDVEITVALDGTAHSPRIIEASIPGVFDQATLGAVNNWRFEPATVNGKPVETTFEMRQTFYFKDNNDAVSESFFRRASGISRALGKDDLEKAWKKIQKLDEKRMRLLAESVYMDFFKATYYEKNGEPALALKHLNRALKVAERSAAKSVRLHMLRSTVKLNAEQRHYASALARYAELQALAGKLPTDDPARVQAMAVRSIIAGKQPLEWEATLERCQDCQPETWSWSHPLVRKRFMVTTVPESIEETRLQCGDRFQYFRLRVGETYQVAGLDEDCYFHTQGWKPASFNLVELPMPEEAMPVEGIAIDKADKGAGYVLLIVSGSFSG